MISLSDNDDDKSKCFWRAVDILINKPHIANKRLWGSKLIFRKSYYREGPNWKAPTTCTKLSDSVNVLKQIDYFLKDLKLKCTQERGNCQECDLIELILMELLPKNYNDDHAFQLICLQKTDRIVTFYDVSPISKCQNLCPEFPYSLSDNNGEIILTTNQDANAKSYNWLLTTVVPLVSKWSKDYTQNNKNQIVCNQSLKLVCNDKYYEKYNKLKSKYGKEMVKIWPECTDPSKFVYEDIAIATYILLLWDNGSGNPQTFIDLGCGNGLLVYILTEEGHKGKGLDVRKRNIWNFFPKNIILKEETIVPSDYYLFPEADWIIGNHSDELTPWIPIIAAKSSYKCKYFLLPCCAFNFDGTKYQRKDSSKSQYNEYLEYIKKLSDDCGFETKVDRLKIPSTKRICLIGGERKHPEHEHNICCQNINSLLQSNVNNTLREENGKTWLTMSKTREPIEKVRNCTQIDKYVINSISTRVSSYLLQECQNKNEWCLGKSVDISELIQLIPEDELKCLKAECGGLATLLKNKHDIFKVQSGKVQLRYPKSIEDVTNTQKKKKSKSNVIIKNRCCWFFNNHPKGCPLTDEKCSFLHCLENSNKN